MEFTKEIKEKAGFYQTKNKGNNSFAFSEGKKIWIPEVKIGTKEEIKLGNKIVFSDFEDGKLKESIGLEKHLWILDGKTPVFVCDNHNRAMEAWQYTQKDTPLLIHIDQHRDEAEYQEVQDWESDLRICDYINWTKDNNWIQKDHISLCESKDFNHFNTKDLKGGFILNIDLDIFVPEQTLVNHKEIWNLIFELSKKAKLITIATSPLFLDQKLALKLLNKFFGN